MSRSSRPAISPNVVMVLVVMASLAGVELMLAQELQFVLDRSRFQAGFVMLPLMVASVVGGPLAGMVLGRLRLRTVAYVALVVSAVCLAGVALSDFNGSGASLALLLGRLGLAPNRTDSLLRRHHWKDAARESGRSWRPEIQKL